MNMNERRGEWMNERLNWIKLLHLNTNRLFFLKVYKFAWNELSIYTLTLVGSFL